jgi:hypothetical protein
MGGVLHEAKSRRLSVKETTRREFLKDAAWAGAAIASCTLAEGRLLAAVPARGLNESTHAAPSAVQLSWLGEQPPVLPAGVSWGVPWPRGAMARDRQITVHSADSHSLPTQSWPLAFWPDGSLKWSGLAIAAGPQLTAPLTVAIGQTAAPESPIQLQRDAQFIQIATGPLRCRIARTGQNLIESISVDGREVARAGRLIVIREDRSAFDSTRTLRDEDYTSQVSKVTVEQSGPVRAVVHIEGVHAGPIAGSGTGSSPARQWLPFSLRLYFTAGLNSVRMVHSFVFDGDQSTDFIHGLGLAFTVPFREERQNRHIRLATDGDGLFSEPVLMSPGYRPRAVEHAAEMNQAQLVGKRIPNLADLAPSDKAAFETIAVWDAFKLNQLAPDSFELQKRTGNASSWLHIANGTRARGLAFLGDVSGGLAVGVKNFWQKYPSALEITGASTAAGEMKIWFWAPDAPAMDLRHYDTVGHNVRISYEDYQEGFSTPNGVANTSELTLWATAGTPDPATLVSMAKAANEPPLLVCTPQYYHDTHTLGVWSLPSRSASDHSATGLSEADLASAEEQLDRAFAFYSGEVERRRWYGFWDFGDFVRTYDPIRHEWMYDIGGHGWNNTELMPNAWLWFAFLRSGRADIFRLAEAMTRNTTEVDVYHSGRFAGLGSRHNVNHWGDGAKEARINEAFLKRFYYYLTTDERLGDLLREPLDVVEQTLVAVPPLREVLPLPIKPVLIRIGPDWLALASNWMAEWERTGDTRYRDYILTGMRDIGAMPDAFLTRGAYRYDPATKHLSDIGRPNQGASEFLFIFGGDQIAMNLIDLIDCPEFARAWFLLCDKTAREIPGPLYSKMRLAAYAANVSHDPELESAAIQLFRDSLKFNGGDRFPATLIAIEGPSVAEPVKETPGHNSFTPAIATPETSQWAIDIVTSTELFRQFHSAITP